jgi:hypothetical protein
VKLKSPHFEELPSNFHTAPLEDPFLDHSLQIGRCKEQKLGLGRAHHEDNFDDSNNARREEVTGRTEPSISSLEKDEFTVLTLTLPLSSCSSAAPRNEEC